MFGRLVVVILSLGVLGGAGYASWYGLGAVDRDTGPASLRAGPVGGVGIGAVRVK
jgi:hypothetical protein